MPIFEMHETTEVAVLVMIGDGSTHDMVGQVMRNGPDQPWYFRYRFRYYDAEPVSSPDAKDTKNVWEVRSKAGSDPETARVELVKAAKELVEIMRAAGFGEMVEIYHINGGPDAWLAVTKGSRFFHPTNVGSGKES